jgi:hypothetical protein
MPKSSFIDFLSKLYQKICQYISVYDKHRNDSVWDCGYVACG